ncbi:hypothetical protein JKP88DRAFT_278186 [Tribonema minus]|uniref:Uncharacterized protein n=1 Tax=Tribonema minus TaxID=303371 RepID=A0A835Z4N9_9STRA|nr:hypothetical protein JKP88DRAFT_278186 [Tribonema minus]
MSEGALLFINLFAEDLPQIVITAVSSSIDSMLTAIAVLNIATSVVGLLVKLAKAKKDFHTTSTPAEMDIIGGEDAQQGVVDGRGLVIRILQAKDSASREAKRLTALAELSHRLGDLRPDDVATVRTLSKG